jgi:hypothetical protein
MLYFLGQHSQEIRSCTQLTPPLRPAWLHVSFSAHVCVGFPFLESVRDLICDTASSPPLSFWASHALLANSLHKLLIVVDMTIERPQRGARTDLAAEYSGLDPPW